MAAIEQPALIQENEYHTLEQTLTGSDRGRRFLAEYLKRHRSNETNSILDAIGKLEKLMVRENRRAPDLSQIRLDVADMHEAIERTKQEIANIKREGEETNRFNDASHELDAIVTQTEGATQDILNAAETIQEQAWILREAGASEQVCDEIDAKATEIFMACSFQDITGQRTQKVVQVLRYLEDRINKMINIWGIEDVSADANAGPVDHRPDAHLLNGPQLAGKGVSQDFVDNMIAGEEPAETVSADFDFDSISVDTDEEPAAAAPQPEIETATLNAADIDAMFENMDTDDSEIDLDTFDAAGVMEEAGSDEPMDVDDIDKLFETAAVEEVTSEAEADADWEAEAEMASDEEQSQFDDEDPLAMLSESERQALFS